MLPVVHAINHYNDNHEVELFGAGASSKLTAAFKTSSFHFSFHKFEEPGKFALHILLYYLSFVAIESL